MKLWNTMGEQILALTHSLLVLLGLVDCRGELTWNATFLCCEAPLCAEMTRHSHEDH